MNIFYFQEGTNTKLGCDPEKDSYYFCQKDGNDCPQKEICKRYLNSEGHVASRLFKVMCNEQNNHLLYIPVGGENNA